MAPIQRQPRKALEKEWLVLGIRLMFVVGGILLVQAAINPAIDWICRVQSKALFKVPTAIFVRLIPDKKGVCNLDSQVLSTPNQFKVYLTGVVSSAAAMSLWTEMGWGWPNTIATLNEVLQKTGTKIKQVVTKTETKIKKGTQKTSSKIKQGTSKTEKKVKKGSRRTGSKIKGFFDRTGAKIKNVFNSIFH